MKKIKYIFLALTILFISIHSSKARHEGFANIVKPLLPAVVNISTTKDISHAHRQRNIPNLPQGSPFEELFRHFFEDYVPRKMTSLGSGFIIDLSGLIVTNNHVVQGADKITVTLNDKDKTELDAKVIGRDPRTDIALIKVEHSMNLPFIKWGDSDDARVGDWAIAIGNPFGLGSTVTAGIISTISRDIQAEYIEGYIQTDAPINMGNSGGPLFNTGGRVIGINTAIASPTGGSVGIGFSIPASVAQDVIKQLKDHGRTRRGWLGVGIQTITKQIAESVDLKTTHGALVVKVYPNSPADKASIKRGDIILKFNSQSIKESRRLPKMVGETIIDKKVPVVVWRKGKEVTLQVLVGEFEKAEKEGLIPSEQVSPSKGTEVLGLTLQPITPWTRQQFQLPKDSSGVLIAKIDRYSEAYDKGVRTGDLIVEINYIEVFTPEDVRKNVSKLRKSGKKHTLVLINRCGSQHFITISLAERGSNKKMDNKDDGSD